MSDPAETSARLAYLEERLRALEARLEQEASARRGLMRETRRCPSCGGREILLAERLQPLHNIDLRVALEGTFSIRSFGLMQAVICAGCGHAELQIEDPGALRGRKHVRVLSSEPGEGPYR